MKKQAVLLILFVFLAISSSFSSSAQKFMEIKKGDAVFVPRDIWIEALNPVPVYSFLGLSFSFGDECIIRVGGKITVIARYNQWLLVEYAKPLYLEFERGWEAPSGVIFLILDYEFSSMPLRYEQISFMDRLLPERNMYLRAIELNKEELEELIKKFLKGE